ncbi:MAG: glycosyltransferase family 4 protein [Bacteroidota bacterium]|nr:glycosyltransferase family 4 protein [Bacteroidota bacterium]
MAKAVKEETKKFHLAGEGPERAKLQALIQQYNLNETFVLKGHIEDVQTFYRSLDLYLNTSVHEGLPMSILEAIACGLPIVAPDVGGIGEVVDNGEDGYLVDIRDPKAFAEKRFLLYKNRQLRRRMAQAAREKIVKSFSVENMAAQYHELYLSVVNKKTGLKNSKISHRERRERRERLNPLHKNVEKYVFGHGLHRLHGLGIKLKDQKMNFTAESAEKNFFIVGGTDRKKTIIFSRPSVECLQSR